MGSQGPGVKPGSAGPHVAPTSIPKDGNDPAVDAGSVQRGVEAVAAVAAGPETRAPVGKARRAQEAVVAARPYADKVLEVISSLALREDAEAHPLLNTRGKGRALVLAVLILATLLPPPEAPAHRDRSEAPDCRYPAGRTVTARVDEFFGFTELTSVVSVSAVGSGMVPAPVLFYAAVPSPDPA